jgi:DnaK suppressor protein
MTSSEITNVLGMTTAARTARVAAAGDQRGSARDHAPSAIQRRFSRVSAVALALLATPPESILVIRTARLAASEPAVRAATTLQRVGPERAQELLSNARARVESELATIEEGGPLEGTERREPGDIGSEDLYEDEVDEGRREDLRDELAAIARAEARVQDGTYGLSVESGEPIPDARLEAVPTAERTVEEEERRPQASG